MCRQNHKIKTNSIQGCLTAVIDCGSNSFRLLITRKSASGLEEISRELITVRLGEGLTAEGGIITAAAERRAIAALKCFQEIIAGYSIPASSVICTGTSALRSAANGSAFVKLVADQLGLAINVVSGKQEAWLSFMGATLDELSGAPGLAVLDIGGGSTELVVQSEQQLESVSVPLGAVRLSNVYINNDPPLQAELWAVERHVKQTWDKTRPGIRPCRCIGVAGTITNLAAIYRQLRVYQPEIVHGTVLTCEDIENILKKLCSVKLAERRRLVGLQPERADIIVAGTQLLLTTMRYFKLDCITVSEKDSMHAIAFYGIPELD